MAGEAALADGRFEDAALSFEAGYSALDAAGRRGDLGEHLVGEAVSAYEQAYQATGDVQLLHRSLRLLRTLARDRGGTLPSIELRAESERLAAVVEKLRADDPPTGPEPPPTGDPTAAEQGASPPNESDDPPSPPPPRPRPDRAAIGLLAGGSVLTAGGIGLLVWGSQVPRMAQGALDERGGTASEDAAFLRRAEGIQTGLLVGGSIAAAAGIGLITWGALRLVRKRRER